MHLRYPRLAMCCPKLIWLLQILRYRSSHVVAAVQNKLFDDKQKVDNHSRIYIWNCFAVKNDVLISVLSVSAIYSVLSVLSAMETSIKLVCNILTLTEKHMKPQNLKAYRETDETTNLKALTNLCYL